MRVIGVIDLDRADPSPPVADGALGRTRLWAVGVICLVVGGFLGGLVTHRWQTQMLRKDQASVVSVVAVADASRWVDDTAQASVWVGRQVTTVFLATHATIINTGPTAVDVLGLAARQPGLILDGIDTGRRIEPGATLPVAVQIQIDCVVSRRLLGVEASLSVETSGGDRRNVSVKIGGDLWARQVEEICASPARWPGQID